MFNIIFLKKSSSLLVFFFILILVNVAVAKDLFVATDGDDFVTYANNDINNPWRTPEKAFYNAQPGDAVYFRSGTYNITSTIDTRGNGDNGTAANPILFQNYYDESVTFSSSLKYVFKIQTEYYTVRGLNFIGSAPTWFDLGEDASADHFTVEDCTADMSSSSGGDNLGFVRVRSGADFATVQRCTIECAGTDSANTNTNCLYLVHAEGVKFLNNELSNAPIGIYYKFNNFNNPNNGGEIAYNYITNTSRNVIQTNSTYCNIHDNIFGKNNADFQINEDNGGAAGDYNTIRHNTLYGISFDLNRQSGGATHNIIKDNVIMLRSEFHRYGSEPHYTDADYNLYPSGDIIVENRIDYTLSEWQNHSGTDVHSLSGSPTFTGGTSPTSIADFELAAESLGKNDASDGKDMGANVSLVGALTQPMFSELSSPLDFRRSNIK